MFQLYDMFAPVVLYGLEAYGFCKAGEGGRFVADGHTETVSATIPDGAYTPATPVTGSVAIAAGTSMWLRVQG